MKFSGQTTNSDDDRDDNEDVNDNINIEKNPYKGWQDQNEDRFEAELVSQVSKDGTEDES